MSNANVSDPQRANRLQTEVRENLQECIEELNDSRRQAIENNDQGAAKNYALKIKEVLAKLDEMSEIALTELNDDDATIAIVKKLGNLSQDLDKSTAEMKTVTDKLTKATEVINTASSFISEISSLVV